MEKVVNKMVQWVKVIGASLMSQSDSQDPHGGRKGLDSCRLSSDLRMVHGTQKHIHTHKNIIHYMYIYVCMYVYIYICMYVYVCICICVYIYIYTHTYSL